MKLFSPDEQAGGGAAPAQQTKTAAKPDQKQKKVGKLTGFETSTSVGRNEKSLKEAIASSQKKTPSK